MLSRLVYSKMIKFSFKSANGNSFTKGLDDMLKKHTDKQVIDEEEPYFSDEELYDEENAY